MWTFCPVLYCTYWAFKSDTECVWLHHHWLYPPYLLDHLLIDKDLTKVKLHPMLGYVFYIMILKLYFSVLRDFIIILLFANLLPSTSEKDKYRQQQS